MRVGDVLRNRSGNAATRNVPTGSDLIHATGGSALRVSQRDWQAEYGKHGDGDSDLEHKRLSTLILGVEVSLVHTPIGEKCKTEVTWIADAGASKFPERVLPQCGLYD